MAHSVHATRRCEQPILNGRSVARAASNGASTLNIANPCFNFHYPVCERRVAVC